MDTLDPFLAALAAEAAAALGLTGDAADRLTALAGAAFDRGMADGWRAGLEPPADDHRHWVYLEAPAAGRLAG